MWRVPDAPANEKQRVATLVACDILDTPREERFDRLSWLAQRFYGADLAFIGFIDADTQWLKSVTSSAIGISVERQKSFCQFVISSGEPLIVSDLHTDERFDGHPAVPQLSLRASRTGNALKRRCIASISCNRAVLLACDPIRLRRSSSARRVAMVMVSPVRAASARASFSVSGSLMLSAIEGVQVP